jgi:CheY-like chemotaxis protein
MRPRHRVLVIEDDPELLELYRLSLSDEGYEVVATADPEEGLALARRHPDVLLLDLRLPGIDGRTLLRHFRVSGATRDIPVVVVSGSVPEGGIPGADAVVRKPFEIGGLVRTIERVSHRAHVGR